MDKNIFNALTFWERGLPYNQLTNIDIESPQIVMVVCWNTYHFWAMGLCCGRQMDVPTFQRHLSISIFRTKY